MIEDSSKPADVAMTNSDLKFIDRLLSSLLSVTKEAHSHGAWAVATSKVASFPALLQLFNVARRKARAWYLMSRNQTGRVTRDVR